MRRTDRPQRLRIGELARTAGLTVEGVRYYERRGLLEPPARSPAGYRLYGPEAVARLAFIRQAKAVGLSLGEIRQILALSRAGVRPCEEVRAFMRRRLADLDRTIGDLKALRQRLAETVEGWEDLPEPPDGGHVCGLIERAAGGPGESPAAGGPGESPAAGGPAEPPGAGGVARGAAGPDAGGRRRASDRRRSGRAESSRARPTAGARSR